MSYHILVIEDNPEINNMIKESLLKNNYLCTQAYSGTEGLLQITSTKFDLIILDLMLPGITGAELLHKIKPQNHIPVIVVSAKDALDSKVELLESGANDYITKPFELKELLARISVQLRSSSESFDTKPIIYKDLCLDKSTYQISLKETIIPLTKQEFKIIELLLTYPNKVFSKQDIYNYAWNDYYLGEDNTINVHISNIRQKIKKITSTEYIETVWGIGFKLSK